MVQLAAAWRRGGYRTRGGSAFCAVFGCKNQGLAAGSRRAAGPTAVCLRPQNVGRTCPPVSQTQTSRWSGRPQPAGDFQERGRRLGREFDDQGEELGERVSRRCAGFCVGCWRILRHAARKPGFDSPWGYFQAVSTAVSLGITGDTAVSFPACCPPPRLYGSRIANRPWCGPPAVCDNRRPGIVMQ